MFWQPANSYSNRSQARIAFGVAAFGALLLLTGARPVSSQCLTHAEVQQMVQRINTGGPIAKNDKLRKELLEMKKNVIVGLRDSNLQAQQLRRMTGGRADTASRVDDLDRTIQQKRDKNAARLCEMLKSYGFLGRSLVGDDGVAAAFYLFKQFTPIELQIGMIPAITAAANKNELPKNDDYAAFIDRLRVHVGLKQLFGTQAFVRDDFLVLAPIEGEQQVDARRTLFNMPPLENYLKYLEVLYKMPLMRERLSGPPVLQQPKPEDAKLSESLQVKLPEGDDSDEVIRVESELVSLNVHVTNKNRAIPMSGLETADFKVYEDGREEQISFFAKSDTPFDLVVLIDMSGSSQNKMGIIREATKRFIEMARPSDRVAIVTFSDKIKVVAPLTGDRKELLNSLDRINDIGYSHVWDGLLYALQNSFGDRPPDRRRAVVMMSDGVDNNLGGRSAGSKTSFAQLLETVRTGDALVVPIYLDTFEASRCPSSGICESEKMYRVARSTLSVLAEESGGQVYYAKKLENLDGVYQNVLSDLGTVYSVGYTPSNEKRDGRWRSLKVEVRGHPDLTAHTRRGYYAKK